MCGRRQACDGTEEVGGHRGMEFALYSTMKRAKQPEQTELEEGWIVLGGCMEMGEIAKAKVTEISRNILQLFLS